MSWMSNIDVYSDLIGLEFFVDVDGKVEKFVVERKWIETMLVHYDPIQFRGDLWRQISDVPLGQGCHVLLYYNGKERIIAVYDILCEESVVIKEIGFRPDRF